MSHNIIWECAFCPDIGEWCVRSISENPGNKYGMILCRDHSYSAGTVENETLVKAGVVFISEEQNYDSGNERQNTTQV